MVLADDADVLDADVGVGGHGAGELVAGGGARGADDRVGRPLQDEQGPAERGARDAVVGGEGARGRGRRPRGVGVDVRGVEGGEGGVAGVVAAADGAHVLQRRERHRLEDRRQVEPVQVRDGEGEEGREHAVADGAVGADGERRRCGRDGAEEARDWRCCLALADGPCDAAAFGVAERDPVRGELREDRLRGQDAVHDVVGVQLVREVVEGRVGAEPDVVGDHDGVAQTGESEDAAEVVLEVAQVGHGALPGDAGRAVGPGDERVGGRGAVEAFGREWPEDGARGGDGVVEVVDRRVHESA